MNYDFGSTSDSLLAIGAALTLPATGSVTINVNPLNYGTLGFVGSGAGGTVFPLVEFGSLTNPYSPGVLTLGVHPTNYTFSFSGTSASEIDLIANYSGPANLTWVGSKGNIWSATASSFAGGMSDGSLTPSNPGDNVTFDDTGSGGVIAIASSGVAPGEVVFGNSNKTYELTGGPIMGAAGLTLSSGGALILDNTNTFTGGVTVNSGTLTVATAGALPDGASLAVAAGAAFVFDPSVASGAPIAASVGSVSAVPEPGTFALLAVGRALIAFRALRRRQK